MRRRIRAAALVLALVLALGTVAAATDTTETTPKPIDYKNAPAQKNGIQVAPLDSQNCKVEFKDNSSEALTVTYTNEKLNVNDMVIVLLLKSSEAVTDSDKAEKVATTLTAGTIQYIDQADVTEKGKVEFTVFPQNYSNGVIRLIWKSSGSDGVNTETVAAVKRTYTLGDANRDGTVDLMDVSAVLMYAVFTEKEEYQNIDLLASNVNGDDTIDIMDVSAILMYAVKDVPFKQSN